MRLEYGARGGAFVERVASALRQSAGQWRPPFSAEGAIERAGIALIEHPELPVESVATWLDRGAAILVRSSLESARRRVALACGLAHHLFSFFDAMRPGAAMEFAEQFALALLLPVDAVRHAMARGHRCPDDLARVFDVPPVFMRLRLRTMH